MPQEGYQFARDNWGFSGANTDNQCWDTIFTINDLGRVQDINAYFGGDTASCTGGPVLWDSTGGTVLAYSGQTVAQGSRSANGASYVTQSGLDIAFYSGASFYIGAFRNASQSWVIPFADNHGNFGQLKTQSGTNPSGASGGTNWNAVFNNDGGIDAYLTYFSSQLYVRRSSAWVKGGFLVQRGGAWQLAVSRPQVLVRRSGAWTLVGQLIREKELDWKIEQDALVVAPDGSWEIGLLRWEYDNPKRAGYFRDHTPKIVRPYEIKTSEGVDHGIPSLQPA